MIPPNSITILSRLKVHRLGAGLNDYDAVVSINDSQESLRVLANVRDHENALILRFDDVFTEADAGNSLATPTAEQVAAIMEFVRANQGCRLLAHCTAGISRSGATGCIARAVWDLEQDNRIDRRGIQLLIEKFHLFPNPIMMRLADDILGKDHGLCSLVLAKAKQEWGFGDLDLDV